MRRLVASLLAPLLVLLCVAARAEEGAQTPPFITTPDEVVERMLRLAATGPGDTVIDLGSGDGRIVIAAAQKFGARGIGIEMDPRLVEKSRENARLAEVADRVSFIEGDVLVNDISQASVVTVYLLPFLIDKLQPRFLGELKPGTRVVSHAFGMVGWKPDRTETMRLTKPHAGQGDESMLNLWIVPAEVRGTWQSSDLKLRIYQNYQELEVEGALGRRVLFGAQGTVSGYDVAWEAKGTRFRGRLEGTRLVGDLLIDGRTESVVLTRAR
jgi:protein-L-isoaspartate O-methyltransferase